MRLDGPRTRLYSGAPWWLLHDGLPPASTDLPARADVAVVGAGITGALVADALTSAGMQVAILDRRLPTTGSTAASTALLQYDLDVELLALTAKIGAADAVRAYRLTSDALEALGAIATSFKPSCDFAWRTSVYLASRAGDTSRLRAETAARTQAGLDATFHAAGAIRDRFGLPGYGAICTSRAAVVDPVRLARNLLDRATAAGATIATGTTACEVRPDGARLVVETDRGELSVKRVVLACGYELPRSIVSGLAELHGTFALVTEPVADFGVLGSDTVVWESRRPYTYLRAVDHRWMIGGMDLRHEGDGHRDEVLPARTRALEDELTRLVPGSAAPTAFSWGGTFGSTDDGLPVIGEIAAMPGVYVAVGYGGNGITFSAVAATIIRDVCLGRPNGDARIFRPDR